MHNWIIERAGLFDFRTSSFSPALQVFFFLNIILNIFF